MKPLRTAEKYREACRLLPERLTIAALDISEHLMDEAEELRLRIGAELALTLSDGERPLPRTRILAEDLEYVLDKATEFSRYTAEQTLRMGFVTAQGGYRIGIFRQLTSKKEHRQKRRRRKRQVGGWRHDERTQQRNGDGERDKRHVEHQSLDQLQ